MPDNDERLIAAVNQLTDQVSRLAWAQEALVRGRFENGVFEGKTCRTCGSMLVPVEYPCCAACREPKPVKTDG
jgi:hypothetical protein